MEKSRDAPPERGGGVPCGSLERNQLIARAVLFQSICSCQVHGSVRKHSAQIHRTWTHSSQVSPRWGQKLLQRVVECFHG